MYEKYVKILDLPFIAEEKSTILNLIAKRVNNEEKTLKILGFQCFFVIFSAKTLCPSK